VAAGTTTVDFLSPEAESRAFWRARSRVVRTLVRQTFEQARFRASLVVMLSALLWGGLFWLFADGMVFLQSAIPAPDLYQLTISHVLGMFFATLLVMLMFSAGLILYSSLFRSAETAYLLTNPVRVERIFLYKFQEALLFSSWGFVLLGSPMLVAYGVVAEAPWYYYALLAPFVAAFIYIPVAIGALVCLAVMDKLPHSRRKVLVGACVAALLAGVWIAWMMLSGVQNDILTSAWFQEMLGRLQLTQGKLLPSWWLTAGLLDAAAGVLPESVKFLAVLIANALFLRHVAIRAAGKTLRRSYSGLSNCTAARRTPQGASIDRGLRRLLAWLPLTIRLMLLKDVRTFRRDPMQWSQFLIFFGLLALYFVNIRRFNYGASHLGWVNMVSFLNVTVVGLLMSTFTTRFVYPMISLEGRRFWLLGLLPIRRDTLLWSKFTFAVISSLIPCSLLVLLSDVMLRVDRLIVASHQLTCLVLCFGLAGIAVGLGARLPNLREESPSRIAAGFGGTLNLVISTLYILAVVLLTAVPAHFYLDGERSPAAQFFNTPEQARWWLSFSFFAGVVISAVLGVVATLLPMWIGLRAFRRSNF
jgi:ABC-2 type transport system permease protein